MTYLRYLCFFFVHSGVQHLLCCVFVLFCLSLSCGHYVASFFLDCPFLIDPSALSNVYLRISLIKNYEL
jgi:hypothetical protein